MCCGVLYDGGKAIASESRTPSTDDAPVEEKDGNVGNDTKGQNSERARL